MTKPRIWSRRTSAALLASVMAAGAMTVVGGGIAHANPTTGPDVLKGGPGDKLGAHDRALLAEARGKGEQTVVVIVTTEKGETKNVAAGLAKLGGKVAKQVDEVGYVRAQLPTSAVLRAAELPGVTAVDLNETVPLPAPDPVTDSTAARAARSAVVAPGADTPAANPFMPTHEIGSVAFKEANPTWDGRGITIGIMDSGIALDNPALQTTTTGERKIVDWFTATDPVFEGDRTWRPMLTSVTGPTFTAAGATWTAPAGTYLFNTFAESAAAGGEVAGDVNRDGDTSDIWGILYNPVTNDIWVDVNQNRNFTDDALMRPYGERFDVGHFGTDNPATPVREQMPFVVEFREDVDTTAAGGPGLVDYVNIGIPSSSHGSHVAGITAANDMFGNAVFDGAAPGAKLVSARACTFAGGCTAAALYEGMIELVVNRGVDVVNMSIGGLPGLNDGNNARTHLYNTLINDYGVQLFLSGGNNGPGVNTSGDPSVASDAVAVAASISQETWLANYGSVTRTPEQLFNFSSRGPREDGGLKPNITAPGSAISTTPLWLPGGPVAEAGYPLPPGYQMSNGTSMAAPQAAGGAALLLSAAKATGRDVTPAQLRRAIYSTGDWIPGVTANGQGNGKFNVPNAWNLLAAGVQPGGYTVDAPVCTPLSGFLATPHRGTGLYNRCAATDGGHTRNVPKQYEMTITRTTGPDRNIKHNVQWLGNDGTFRNGPKNIILPLNQPVKIHLEARGDYGDHSAIMRVDDPATPWVDFEFMNTVVVAKTTTAPDFSYAVSGTVDRNLFKTYFVNVPQGAKSLQVNLSGLAEGSQTRFVAFNPQGIPVDSTQSTQCFSNFPSPCKPDERSYDNPQPGIWEIEVESRRTSPQLENPYQLRARIQGVTVDPDVVELPSVVAGEPTPVSLSVTNDYGPVNVTAAGGQLGSALSQRPTIAHLAVSTYQVVVPAGASRLVVRIGNPADPAADLDLFIYRNGAEVGRSAGGSSEETVTLTNPPAGTYTIEIDGYSVPAGTTEYDYLDVFYSTALGAVTAPSTPLALAHGATGTLTGSVTVLSVPAAGRQLSGELQIVTDEGAVVGRGALEIGTVN
ncbi:S8 family serine peptidase [Polymorphospora rubra]|uniref:S8 family serine peptidase n=1 Tax=Polymorphospora rubra TaxID=338584 RepID=UPI0033E79F09